jgi:RNA polymerase sigma factor (sigma-70 family)
MSIEAFESVLSGAQAGAAWALTILYRDLQPRVLRYLAVREPAEAEDLASEVWLDVAAGIGRFRGDEDGFRAWVFTIARRRLLDLRRRASVRRDKPVPLELLGGGDRGIGDVEGEALASLEADAAIALIATLPPDQSDVVLLRVLGDLSVADVAKILGKRPGAIRALQHRALKGLALKISHGAVTE